MLVKNSKVFIWAALVVAVFGVAVPSTMYFVLLESLPSIVSEHDVELVVKSHVEALRESDRLKHAVPPPDIEPFVRPEVRDFPAQLLDLLPGALGCVEYVRGGSETSARFALRALLAVGGRSLPGDGRCEFLYARALAYQVGARTRMEASALAYRIRSVLGREKLLVYALETYDFDEGIVGLSQYVRVSFNRKLSELSLGQMAQIALAFPPTGEDESARFCLNPPLLKTQRNELLDSMTDVGVVQRDAAALAKSEELLCP